MPTPAIYFRGRNSFLNCRGVGWAANIFPHGVIVTQSLGSKSSGIIHIESLVGMGGFRDILIHTPQTCLYSTIAAYALGFILQIWSSPQASDVASQQELFFFLPFNGGLQFYTASGHSSCRVIFQAFIYLCFHFEYSRWYSSVRVVWNPKPFCTLPISLLSSTKNRPNPRLTSCETHINVSFRKLYF